MGSLRNYLDVMARAGVALRELLSNKATDFSIINNTLYPSVQAVQAYVDARVVGLLNDRGNYDASVNLYPSSGGSGIAGSIKKGDVWYISVAGVLGGSNVYVGDTVRALIDAPGQTAGNWSVMQYGLSYVPAPLNSAALTGTPSAPTPAIGTMTTQLATSEFANSINLPAFRAYAGDVTSVTSSPTKARFNSESFDTHNAFDAVTNFRFQPGVAGWYRINARIQFTTSNYVVTAAIYLNGSPAVYGDDSPAARSVASVGGLVHLNGSTDYVEIMGTSATTQNTATGAGITFMEAFRVWHA